MRQSEIPYGRISSLSEAGNSKVSLVRDECMKKLQNQSKPRQLNTLKTY